ncbi:MAG: nucleotidyltransferase family protein [Ruminococcus sp.]
MTDTIYTPEQIQQILFPVFLQYPVKKAILFGSYAKGTAETKSDIDIFGGQRAERTGFFRLAGGCCHFSGKRSGFAGCFANHAGF